MTVKERLKRFIRSQAISINEFQRTVGVSTAFVSSISQSIQPDKLQRISLQYPRLNIEWLLTGEGEMLKNVTSFSLAEKEEASQLAGESRIRLEIMQQTIDELKKEIRHLTEENAILRYEARKLNEGGQSLGEVGAANRKTG